MTGVVEYDAWASQQHEQQIPIRLTVSTSVAAVLVYKRSFIELVNLELFSLNDKFLNDLLGMLLRNLIGNNIPKISQTYVHCLQNHLKTI